jgi:hypothetical protein
MHTHYFSPESIGIINGGRSSGFSEWIDDLPIAKWRIVAHHQPLIQNYSSGDCSGLSILRIKLGGTGHRIPFSRSGYGGPERPRLNQLINVLIIKIIITLILQISQF